MNASTLRTSTLALCLGLFLLAAGQTVIAQTPPKSATAPKTEEPDTQVLSDTLSYDDAKKTSVFTGNVILTRGLMKLTSDRLDLREDAQGFQYGVATVDKSRYVFIRQERPENYEVVEARGDRGEYDGKLNTVKMVGHATVTRFICGKPFDTINGEVVTFNNQNNTYSATGGPTSAAQPGRVRSIAQPRAKTDQAVAECRKLYNNKPMPSSIASKPAAPGTPGKATQN
ncbi:sugar ABC transporter substrate-binding protein [Advenella kashmirensis W13003]|uniref:Lipopolysaccharide export system protein LptA n=1 Tax=Advenella kashmirensis W13003 TaxID=1424334 RepID=V8QU35_9BURK|nr:lipopolysaccharide transport periplasmic protein LptA [Advenella kashmirensis]ETF03137.1 sugar ABC transporter substrate-binding protein [Advenella kashmirensis W13003]